MKPSLPVSVFVTLCLATACSGSSARPVPTTPRASSPAATSAPPVTRSHQAVLHKILAEREVHRVDVDGDGRPDTVTLSWTHLRAVVLGAGTANATVHFASGGLASVAWHVTDWKDARRKHSMPYLGAANMDGRPGRELLVGWNIGASNTFFEVFTYREGTLQRIPPPPGSQGWEIGGSVGTGSQAFGCQRGELVAVAALPAHPNRMLHANDYAVTTRTYRWASTGWELLALRRHIGAQSTRLPVRACRGLEPY